MMRPVSVVLPPVAPDGLTWSVTGNGNNTRLLLTWNDNSVAETSYVIQRRSGPGGNWTDIGSVDSPLDQPNTSGGTKSYTDTTFRWNSTLYQYRVVGRNTAGYGGQFMSEGADSMSGLISVIATPTNLSASLQGTSTAPAVRLTWTDNGTNETGFAVERSNDGGATFALLATAPPRNNTGTTSYVDSTVSLGTTYVYRVSAVNGAITSSPSNTVEITVSLPNAPGDPGVTVGPDQGGQRRLTVTWTDLSDNEGSFTVQRATNATFTAGVSTTTVAANTTTATLSGLSRSTAYYVRVRANNVLGSSGWVDATPSPITTNP